MGPFRRRPEPRTEVPRASVRARPTAVPARRPCRLVGRAGPRAMPALVGRARARRPCQPAGRARARRRPRRAPRSSAAPGSSPCRARRPRARQRPRPTGRAGSSAVPARRRPLPAPLRRHTPTTATATPDSSPRLHTPTNRERGPVCPRLVSHAYEPGKRLLLGATRLTAATGSSGRAWRARPSLPGSPLVSATAPERSESAGQPRRSGGGGAGRRGMGVVGGRRVGRWSARRSEAAQPRARARAPSPNPGARSPDPRTRPRARTGPDSGAQTVGAQTPRTPSPNPKPAPSPAPEPDPRAGPKPAEPTPRTPSPDLAAQSPPDRAAIGSVLPLLVASPHTPTRPRRLVFFFFFFFLHTSSTRLLREHGRLQRAELQRGCP